MVTRVTVGLTRSRYVSAWWWTGTAIEVGYEVFDGNVRDHATVSGMLEKLRDRFGICSPTVCMDRGMVTEETLSLLRDGYRWIVTESREKAREYACKADTGAWQVIRRDSSGAVLIEVQEIRLRPVFHQKDGRVEAHILLSYIAYVLLWCIEHTHRAHGGTLTGRRVLDVLSGIELATITLRAGDGRKIALERISSPRTEEAQVLDSLGVRLPRKPRADRPPDLQLSLIDSGDQFSP